MLYFSNYDHLVVRAQVSVKTPEFKLLARCMAFKKTCISVLHLPIAVWEYAGHFEELTS